MGWVVNSTFRPLYPRERDPVPVYRTLGVQLVEALRYKPEARGFGSRRGHWDSSLIKSFWPHYGSGGKGGRCVGLTMLPPSCADCLDIPKVSTSWSLKGLYRICFYLSVIPRRLKRRSQCYVTARKCLFRDTIARKIT